MKILKAIAITAFSISFSLLVSLSTQAQEAPSEPTTPSEPTAPSEPTTAPTAPISNNWKDYSNIEAGFMQGCLGKQALLPAQKRVKQSFCQCAFTAYKTRYTPQTFMQINSLVVKIGQDGTSLLGLMMQPEVEACFTETGYRP